MSYSCFSWVSYSLVLSGVRTMKSWDLQKLSLSLIFCGMVHSKIVWKMFSDIGFRTAKNRTTLALFNAFVWISFTCCLKSASEILVLFSAKTCLKVKIENFNLLNNILSAICSQKLVEHQYTYVEKWDRLHETRPFFAFGSLFRISHILKSKGSCWSGSKSRGTSAAKKQSSPSFSNSWGKGDVNVTPSSWNWFIIKLWWRS